MNLYVLRHAHAGSRSNWEGDDRLRPLSKKGRRQAVALSALLADAPGAGAGRITRLISSPTIRCIESLQPLAERLGLPIDDDPRLAEGSGGEAALELTDELRRTGTVAVLCSHGDVIPEMLWKLKADGTTFHHPLTWPKGSTWVLTGDATTPWTDAHLLPTPEV